LPARTIDEVIARLDEVIARSRRERSRLGYFALLYRNVTVKVKEGIQAGVFEDNARMERLDVVFASRYLDAYESYRRGEQTSKCWLASFRAADSWFPIVLQHLLLGMNAHINLDLAIAAAEVAPGDQIERLKHDFVLINDILRALISDVQDRLARISYYMTILDRFGGRTDEALMNFSINKAREASWRVAVRLAKMSPEEREREIKEIDRTVALLARLIQYPGLKLRTANILVRFSEGRDLARIYDILQ
jgi:hypothetical protein